MVVCSSMLLESIIILLGASKQHVRFILLSASKQHVRFICFFKLFHMIQKKDHAF